MPTEIQAFHQLGSFLMIVMTFSWFYSTFFFQSLLSVFGAKGNFCQLTTSTFVGFAKMGIRKIMCLQET